MAEHFGEKGLAWVRDALRMADKGQNPTLALQWAQTYLLLELGEGMESKHDDDGLLPLPGGSSHDPHLGPSDFGL